MNRVRINDYTQLSSLMYKGALSGNEMYAIVFYDDAMELLRKLVAFEDVEIVDLEASTPMFSGYCKEYFVTLSRDMELFVSPAWHEDNEYWPAGYLDYEADFIYIDGDASYSILAGKDTQNICEIIWAIKDRNYRQGDCSMFAVEDGIDMLLSGLADLGYTEQNCAILANAIKAIDSLIEE